MAAAYEGREPRGLKADRPYSRADINSFAWAVRRRLFRDNPAAKPLVGMRLLEGVRQWTVSAGGTRRVSVDYAVRELPLGVDAETTYDEEDDALIIAVSEETYGFLEDEVPRGTFTVGHEVGHVFLHAEQLVRLSRINRLEVVVALRRRKTHRFYEDTEWQADTFAAELQTPVAGLELLERQGRLTLANVQAQFNVSAEAAGFRLASYRERGRR